MPSGVRLIMNNLSHVFTQRKAKSEWRNKIIIRCTKGTNSTICHYREGIRSKICQKKKCVRFRSRYFCSRGPTFFFFTPFILNKLFSTLEVTWINIRSLIDWVEAYNFHPSIASYYMLVSVTKAWFGRQTFHEPSLVHEKFSIWISSELLFQFGMAQPFDLPP